MKYLLSSLALGLVFVFSLAFTMPTFAQGLKGSSDPVKTETETSQQPNKDNFQLVPCDGFSGKIGDETGVDCDFNMFVELLNRLLRYFIFLFGPIATAMLCYAGFIYLKSSDDPGMLAHAKGMIKNIVIGVCLVLGAWLIVYEFLNALLVDSFKIGNTTQTKEDVIKLKK